MQNVTLHKIPCAKKMQIAILQNADLQDFGESKQIENVIETKP